MKSRITPACILVALYLPTQLMAHQNVDFLRSTGKIYVVVAVLLLIFVGIVYYLFRMDRRLNQLEEKLNNNG